MHKIAVVLSGCGVFDGTEIQEAVLTLLYLDQAGIDVTCLAPNIKQRKVVNHLTGEAEAVQRSVLVESARIARGEIIDLDDADPTEYSAVIFPGGFGAALNLCNFAEVGESCTINSSVLSFAQAMIAGKKALGFICIAPAMIPLLFSEPVSLTIGQDVATVETITQMGGQHVAAAVTDIVVDEQHRVVSTPAYMLGQRISEVASGIEKLVSKILELIA